MVEFSCGPPTYIVAAMDYLKWNQDLEQHLTRPSLTTGMLGHNYRCTENTLSPLKHCLLTFAIIPKIHSAVKTFCPKQVWHIYHFDRSWHNTEEYLSSYLSEIMSNKGDLFFWDHTVWQSLYTTISNYFGWPPTIPSSELVRFPVYQRQFVGHKWLDGVRMQSAVPSIFGWFF